MPDCSTISRMTTYMAWADDVMLRNVETLPEADITAPRNTLFKNIAGTFDHILVVAEMFLAHLEGRTHPYRARHRDVELPFKEVAQKLREIDGVYVSLANSWTQKEVAEIVCFEFVGGGTGTMTRADILLHLVNHATYHRGFISTLIYPLKQDGAANDLTVFLRDVWPSIQNTGKETME